MSTNTGVAPVRAIQPAVAKKVNGVVMTSSPGPRPRLIIVFSRASVPLDAPTAYLHPLSAATSRSSSATLGPPMQTCDSSTSETAASTSSRIVAYCAFKSSRGTFMISLPFASDLALLQSVVLSRQPDTQAAHAVIGRD